MGLVWLSASDRRPCSHGKMVHFQHHGYVQLSLARHPSAPQPRIMLVLYCLRRVRVQPLGGQRIGPLAVGTAKFDVTP